VPAGATDCRAAPSLLEDAGLGVAVIHEVVGQKKATAWHRPEWRVVGRDRVRLVRRR